MTDDKSLIIERLQQHIRKLGDDLQMERCRTQDAERCGRSLSQGCAEIQDEREFWKKRAKAWKAGAKRMLIEVQRKLNPRPADEAEEHAMMQGCLPKPGRMADGFCAESQCCWRCTRFQVVRSGTSSACME